MYSIKYYLKISKNKKKINNVRKKCKVLSQRTTNLPESVFECNHRSTFAKVIVEKKIKIK